MKKLAVLYWGLLGDPMILGIFSICFLHSLIRTASRACRIPGFQKFGAGFFASPYDGNHGTWASIVGLLVMETLKAFQKLSSFSFAFISICMYIFVIYISMRK